MLVMHYKLCLLYATGDNKNSLKHTGFLFSHTSFDYHLLLIITLGHWMCWPWTFLRITAKPLRNKQEVMVNHAKYFGPSHGFSTIIYLLFYII